MRSLAATIVTGNVSRRQRTFNGTKSPVSASLKPIDRFCEGLYLYSPKGAQYTADGLRARFGRWLADTEEGRELGRRWKEWIATQVKKYEWDNRP
jgi:hypothetical protein